MKAQRVVELSSYVITWVEVRPINGLATKKDIQKLDAVRLTSGRTSNGNIYLHFPDRAIAEQWLAKAAALKLSKKYEVRFFSDKQFGMRRESNGYAVPFTRKQEAEVTLIG